MPDALVQSPFFGLLLSIAAYQAGLFLNRQTKQAFANPLLIAILLCVLFLKLLNIPLEAYQAGGSFITLFLGPATVSLALSMYRKLDILKENILPVLAGCTVGSAVSIGCVLLLCRLFGLDDGMTASLLPKSVTTPIAMEISVRHGGMASVTVAAVVFTGILGAVFAPVLIKVFRIKNKVTAGVAIGTSSHAVGTARALELDETIGAMSGISIGVAGLATVLLSLFL